MRDKLGRFIKGSNKGVQNPGWKGDKVSYGGLHAWVRRELGRPIECSKCNSKIGIQWANVSQKYLRDLSDWIQLCGSCHFKFDYRNQVINKRIQSNNTSSYKGISWDKERSKWKVFLNKDKERIYFKRFNSLQGAWLARKWAEKIYFKDFRNG